MSLPQLITGTRTNLWTVLPGLLGGMAVTTCISPFDRFFWGNVVDIWGPQAAILIILLILRAPKPVIGGTALAMALYLALFYLWFFTGGRGDVMAWFVYLFSLPGALIGACLALRLTKLAAPLTALALAGAWVAAGLVINQTIICSTLLYCLG
ncbi:hypothetical protein V0R55_12420 [Pseudomonas soli]|uniref:Uncharacterized protein n=1 Tax=Pseudomonas soli TaxID=1306993 RepID=A0A1H9NIS6_9PSED|nr:hypothetical protein [Pseudomonas soli]MEE1880968.1 hypothetical protein [Pseudomonas soli]SER35657.1 hypothetical protein SAMN05216230_107212 [Pseudomonas soli]